MFILHKIVAVAVIVVSKALRTIDCAVCAVRKQLTALLQYVDQDEQRDKTERINSTRQQSKQLVCYGLTSMLNS